MTKPRARVLVVDDEDLNRELLRRVLGAAYDVREAADAFQAMTELVVNGPVDVVVCDQLMPGKSGTMFAREVKEKWPSIVTILLTGYADSGDVLDAQQSGVIFEVVGKPMLVSEFRDIVMRAEAEGNRRRQA